jgi:hypothetical protein
MQFGIPPFSGLPSRHVILTVLALIALGVGGLGNSLDTVNDEHFAKPSRAACNERWALNCHAASAPDVARRRAPGVARRRPPGDDGSKIGTKPTNT